MKCLRSEPKSFFARLILGWAYERKGKFPEAITELRQAVQLTNNAPVALAAYGEVLAEAGDRRGPDEILRQLRERAKSRYVSAYDVSMIYAALADKTQAFEWLQKAERDRASFLPYITWDRRADGLRSDPRYAALLQRLGLRQAEAPKLAAVLATKRPTRN